MPKGAEGPANFVELPPAELSPEHFVDTAATNSASDDFRAVKKFSADSSRNFEVPPRLAVASRYFAGGSAQDFSSCRECAENFQAADA